MSYSACSYRQADVVATQTLVGKVIYVRNITDVDDKDRRAVLVS
ncbi:MAG: hypothetical protein P0107_08945 [Nitrosomonas sp.]|nr:hypothetical protein [Nitrosomonas sp.]